MHLVKVALADYEKQQQMLVKTVDNFGVAKFIHLRNLQNKLFVEHLDNAGSGGVFLGFLNREKSSFRL